MLRAIHFRLLVGVLLVVSAGWVLSNNMFRARLEPSNGLPAALHVKLTDLNHGIEANLFECPNTVETLGNVEDCVAVIKKWEPSSPSGREMKNQELAMLSKYQELLKKRISVENTWRKASNGFRKTRNIIFNNEQCHWRSFCEERHQILVNLMQRIDLLAASTMSR
jgi:hypothetical protein